MKSLCEPSLLLTFSVKFGHDVAYSDVTSEQSQLTFNVYDRQFEEGGFLGFLEMKPAMVHEATIDQWLKCAKLAPLRVCVNREFWK